MAAPLHRGAELVAPLIGPCRSGDRYDIAPIEVDGYTAAHQVKQNPDAAGFAKPFDNAEMFRERAGNEAHTSPRFHRRRKTHLTRAGA